MFWRRQNHPDSLITEAFCLYGRSESLLAQTLLDSAGFRYAITGNMVQDYFGWGRIGWGFNYIIGPTQVWAMPEDAEAIRELLSDIQPSQLLITDWLRWYARITLAFDVIMLFYTLFCQ